MITSTSSSTKRIAPVWLILALVVLATAAVVLACCISFADRGRPSVQIAVGQTQNRNSLHSTLQTNFDLATQGMSAGRNSIVAMPRDNSAGLICSPAILDRRSIFRMILPAHAPDRKGVLAALTPDGSLRIIYESYGIDTDPEDLIIPSRAIDWQSVRSRNDFAIDVNKFDALRPDKVVPELLFQQPGIYQFALLNGSDRGLLAINEAAFWVIAGCVVRYQP
jgi:hypothetical protein